MVALRDGLDSLDASDANGITLDVVKRLHRVLMEDAHPLLSDIRADAAAHRLPRLLLGHPVTSITEVASLLGTSFQTASTAVDLLVDRGILQDRYPERKRNRIFHASALLTRLERN